MKLSKLLSALTLLCAAAFSHGAFADVCTWSINGIQTTNTGVTLTYACWHGAVNAATKTTIIPHAGAVTCSLNLNSKYQNTGTCATPNILVKPTSCPVINIGITCSSNYSSSCGEAFGRACAAAGGVTSTEFGEYVCRKRC
jgi:hypothetical protein